MPRIYEDEDLFTTLTRNPSRMAHQAVATTLGLPGDLANMLLGFVQRQVDPENVTRWQNGEGGRFPLPTSSDIENLFKATTGRFLPENYITGARNAPERILDFVGANVPFMGKALTSGAGSLMKALARPVASGTAMEGVQGLGGGLGAQLGTGIGTDILFDLLTNRKLTPKSLIRHGEGEQERFAEATKKAITKGAKEPTKELRDEVLGLINEASNKSVKETKNLRPELYKLANDLDTGKMTIPEAWARKTSFEEMAYGDKVMPKYERNQYKRLGRMMDLFIKEHGDKYPGFMEGYDVTKDVTKGIRHKSNLQRSLENVYSMEAIRNSPVKGIIAPLLALGGIGSMGSVKGLGAMLAGGALYRGTQYYDIMKNSKIMQKYVMDLVKSSISGSTKQAGKIALKMSDYIKKNPPVPEPDGFLD